MDRLISENLLLRLFGGKVEQELPIFSKTMREIIKDLPSAEPQTGHWIKKKGGSDNYYYECSKCGCLSPHTECADSIIWKKSNYCPDCGCRMVEPNTDNDLDMKLKLMEANINGYTQGLKDASSDVLDKVIAEIEALSKTYPFINHIDTYVKEDDVKKIIDKYKGEQPKIIKCPNCGNVQFADKGWCPDCGAKMVEPTCDACEYNTAAFNPCNACKDKSEYKPQEIRDRNLKMWKDIFEAESEDNG